MPKEREYYEVRLMPNSGLSDKAVESAIEDQLFGFDCVTVEKKESLTVKVVEAYCEDCGRSWEGIADDVGYDVSRHNQNYPGHNTEVLDEWLEVVEEEENSCE
jgi:hypothetical protein